MTVFLSQRRGTFHLDYCYIAAITWAENQEICEGELEAFDLGYAPCHYCVLRNRHPWRVYAATKSKRFRQARADAFLARSG